jgi:UDP-N-acetylglucosamine--N-acetylmuramyl-(pentapeptide) pyrophosphoryl-undecaprenol N-acetylglucosamine transferase
VPERILLVAGGTGGHVIPAIALAEVLVDRGYTVEFVTDVRGEKFFTGTNITPYKVNSSAIPKDWKGRIKAALKIGMGIIQSLDTLRETEPKAIVGFGGYPSFPTMFAAQLIEFPTIIHEQNAIFGRASNQVAGQAKAIATSFPETRGIKADHQNKVVYTGRPLRKNFTVSSPYQAPQDSQPFNLLIFAGSQGSALFSQVIPQSLAQLPANLRIRLAVTQQCRPEDIEAVNTLYHTAGINAKLKAFYDDMPQQLDRAHLVIARAGGSVAEITAMGRPAILIPLAASLDGDQAANAEQMVNNKAAWVIEEKDFTPEALTSKLAELMTNPAQLAEAAQGSRELGKADAASRLADVVIAVVNKKDE